MSNITLQAAPLEVLPPNQQQHLPQDLANQALILEDVERKTKNLKYYADGMLFGLVGLDALLGIIPGVGAIYSGGMGAALMHQANRAHVSLGKKLVGTSLILIDMAVGFIPGLGDLLDALLRHHAIFANSIIETVQDKLLAIRTLEQEIEKTGHVTDEQIIQVRDLVFRGGKSQLTIAIQFAAMVLLAGFMLHSCHQQQIERQSTIRTCIEQGGWFCSLRH